MRMHENYDTKTFENDIAVLTLDRTVPFSKTVYPICLPPKGELFANRRAFVIGEFSNCFVYIHLQGYHGGLRLDFVVFNSGVPPVCPFAMP